MAKPSSPSNTTISTAYGSSTEKPPKAFNSATTNALLRPLPGYPTVVALSMPVVLPRLPVRQLGWTSADFCRDASVAMRTLTNPQEQKIGDGCDPAVSPDGKRIAYVTRPSRTDTSSTDSGFTAGNKLHLVNLQGANGWHPSLLMARIPVTPKPVWSFTGRCGVPTVNQFCTIYLSGCG
jgi:hypothetical protein